MEKRRLRPRPSPILIDLISDSGESNDNMLLSNPGVNRNSDSGISTEMTTYSMLLEEEEEQLKLAENKPKQQLFECHICHKRFANKANRNRHVSKIHDEEAFIRTVEKTGESFKTVEVSGSVARSNDFENDDPQKSDHSVKCNKCDAIFKNRDELRLHLINKHDQPVLRCQKHCDELFSSRGSQVKHEKSCIPNEETKKILCYICHKIFYSSLSLRTHVQNSHATLKCNCGKVFKSYTNLEAHIKSAHILKCPILKGPTNDEECSNMTDQNSEILQPNIEDADTKSSENDVQRSDIVDQNSYQPLQDERDHDAKTSNTKRTASDEVSFDMTDQGSSTLQPDKEEVISLVSSTSTSHENQNNFDLECNCGAKFMVYKALKAHLKSCNAERPLIFKCRIYCSKVFTDTWKRADHEKVCSLEEEKEVSHICYLCFKICLDTVDLYKHLKRKHKNDTFKCRKCEKVLISHHRLKHHYVAIHKRTLKCRVHCDTYFGNEPKRAAHEEKCVPEEQRKKYLCYVCFKILYSNEEVKRHVKKYHDVMQCKKCDAILPNFQNLRTHYIKRHKGNQKCNQDCDEESKNEAKRSKPENKHTGMLGKRKTSVDIVSLSDNDDSDCDENENFTTAKCKICSAELPTVDHLKRHMQRAHPGSRMIIEQDKEDMSEFYRCTKCLKAFKFKTALKMHRDKFHPQKWVPHPKKTSSNNSDDGQQDRGMRRKRSKPNVVPFTVPILDPEYCKICIFLSSINLKHQH